MNNVEASQASEEFKKALRDAEALLDKGRGSWIPVLTAGLGFGGMIPFASLGASIVAGIGGAIIGLVVIAVMRNGPWGAKGAIIRACSRAGLSKEEAVPHLPARLRYAPDIREFLDATGFKEEMQARFDDIQKQVQAALTKPLSVDDAKVRSAASHPTEQFTLAEGSADDMHTLRIHAVHVVCKVISDEMQNIISARMKRAGQIMLGNIGMQADVNTSLQLALNQSNAEMTQQWAKFYALYAMLGGALINVLRDWDEEEAIDTLMAWPGDLRPFLGLAKWLSARKTKIVSGQAVRRAEATRCRIERVSPSARVLPGRRTVVMSLPLSPS